ncbi:interferon gamma-like [Cottoperca gobio]|uniref:Interferon gamma-like n=1 Tax=Cottoperca gobio TaxID=56716 RepID=A0A6J2PF19_COTGO|nr:interferon gamma-like [Cottoperca gobio]
MVAAAKALVCLSLWLSVCHIRGAFIPVNMNKTIQNLLQYYKIGENERFNGKPVFSREPLYGKMEAKRVFMVGVLETYERLIEQMLRQLPTPSPQTALAGTASGSEGEAGGDVRTELSYILKKIQYLRKYRYQEQEKLLQSLKTLKHIQMDNSVVQSKALWELPWLYEEASMLNDNINRQRR